MGSYRSPSSNIEDAIKNHSWNTVATKFPLNHDFSFLGGAKIKLFNKNLSIFGTLSNANSFNHHTGVYKNYRSNILNKSFTDAEKFSNTIITTGLLNIIYDINQNNNLSFHSLFINKMSDELYEQGRNGQGYFYDQEPQDTATFMRDQNLKNTLIFINQLIGSHKINDRNLLEWAVGFNMVNAGEPNRIRNKVIMLEEDNLYFVRQTYYEQSKSYQKIADLEINGYLKDKLDLIDSDEKKLKLIYGINFRLKSRSFTSLKRSVVSKARGNSIDNLDYVLLNSELYSNNSLIFQNSAKEDLYNSYLLAYAGYANAVFDLKKLSGSVGIRFESDLINSNWDVTNYLGREGDLKNNYYNVLPALNLKYNLSESNAIRIAASKTLTLPEFKELSPFEYVSPTGQVTKGNPDLKKSTNYNVDVKWELFPSLNELFSVSGFYKQINNPINRAQTRGSSGNFFFANTGEKANVYGLEIEARFDLIKSKETGQPSLNISMNASKMWFSQDLLEDFVYNYKTTTGLQGASGFISNASLRYSSNTEKKFTATLIGNYSSDKIYSLGAPESKHYSNELFNNEIIEKGFTTIDFVMSKKISDKISLKFSAKNLLNPSIEQTQEIEPQSGEAFTEVVRSYKKGISISLGLKINLK
ncbi:MAG: TonB-dependent receptor [Prolixibacteraceae bacterium]|nr:TonB-dependent receptor [Prolixibacteraceae bacterium]